MQRFVALADFLIQQVDLLIHLINTQGMQRLFCNCIFVPNKGVELWLQSWILVFGVEIWLYSHCKNEMMVLANYLFTTIARLSFLC